MVTLIVGMLAGQFGGSGMYWLAKDRGASEMFAAVVAGLSTAIVASAVYVPLHLENWLSGPGTSWGASVFIGICIGICQGVLFRGRPFGAVRRAFRRAA